MCRQCRRQGTSHNRIKKRHCFKCACLLVRHTDHMMTSSNGNTFRITGHLCGNSAHKDQWRGALMFSLICVWINGWVNKREAGGLRRYRAHYDVTVMQVPFCIMCDNSMVIPRADRFTRSDNFARNTGTNTSQFLWHQFVWLVHNDLKKRLVAENHWWFWQSKIFDCRNPVLVFKLMKYLLQNFWYNSCSVYAHWAAFMLRLYITVFNFCVWMYTLIHTRVFFPKWFRYRNIYITQYISNEFLLRYSMLIKVRFSLDLAGVRQLEYYP